MTVRATRRSFLKVTAAGAAIAGTESAGCAHRPRLRGEAAPSPKPPAEGDTVDVEVTVNGKSHQIAVHPDDSALDLVRHRVGLTGCKEACGHGACGACTMQLDGTPVATCILPATSLHRRRVTTVEGIGGRELHAIQKALIAHDGLQCGFCTPGFVVEGAAFVDRWRRQHATVAPTRDQVAAALSGHLCRCGAYEGIYAAVIAACEGKHDGPAGEPPRYDAREKVTGEAQYTFDVALPGMLHAAVLPSPHASAIVTALDWSKALALPGVRGAVELLGEARTIRYVGQKIVAIAAVDERTARAAVELVDVEYEVREPALDRKAAQRPESPAVYAKRRDRKHVQNSTEGPLPPAKWSGNLRGPLTLLSKKKGAARRGIEGARDGGHVVEGQWSTHCQSHTCLEPHCAVARFEGETLQVWVSTQGISAVAKDIAERWGLKEDDVRVVAHYIGGGFGGKSGVESETVVAVELAKVTGAPVRYAADRRTELMTGGNRPAVDIDLALGVDDAGALAGMTASAVSNPGTAAGGAVSLLWRVMYHEAPKELADFDVNTHTPPSKPFRGPNGPAAFWALEQAVDAIAHARGEDPVALRKRWDPNPARQALYDWVAELPAWRDRASFRADRGRYRRGVGMAAACWFAFVEPRSTVELTASSTGLKLTQASQDIGNGTRSVLARTVAERFGLAPSQVELDIGDSQKPWGVFSAGSRTTSTVCPAADNACDRLQAELAAGTAKRLKLKGAAPKPAGIEHDAGVVPWSEVFSALAEPLTVTGRRKKDEGGYFLPPIGGFTAEKAVSGGVVVTHVEIDTRLGKTKVLETWGGFGVGRIVHPELATSQAKGGIIQAISYALYEERRLDPSRGFLLTSGLEDYRIIGIGDVGPIHVHFDENGYERIRGRQVGLGELVTVAPAAAIGNAVFDATGFRPRHLPLRPDVVLKGVAS